MEVVLVLVGVAVGFLTGWLWSRTKSAGTEEKWKQASATVQSLNTDIKEYEAKVLDLTDKLAAANADLRNLEKTIEGRQQELHDLQEKFALQFKQLANDIFEDKSRRFTEQNKSNLLDLLKPLGEKISDFEKRVNDTHKDTVSGNSALRAQIGQLSELNRQMTVETENLARALKGDSQKQGAWGEFILENILIKSGLKRDREYTVQESFSSEEGRIRPDVIVRLPDDKVVVIDSKMSLNAYNNFVNAETDEDGDNALKAHLLSIRQHMKGLADKDYQKYVSDNGLDFVIMFVPIEPAYILAIQGDVGLYEEALEKRIVFVGPTLLIPSLQLIKNMWNQENQSRHALDIANKAGNLYDKFVGFTNDLIALGRSMESTRKYYEGAMNKLSNGKGNLVGRVEELKQLGAKASKSIEPNLVNRSADGEQTSQNLPT